MKHEDEAAVFDIKNPQVWELFKKLAFEAKRKHYERFSARAIIHLIRWNTTTETDGRKYKISNNFSPYYAKKFIREFPEFEGFFVIKGSNKEEQEQMGFEF